MTVKVPASQIRAVERFHRGVRGRIVHHFHESETARLPGIPVLHDLHPLYLSVCGKRRVEVLFGGLERNVPDVYILQSVLLLTRRKAGFFHES